jgi:hypothetical protein
MITYLVERYLPGTASEEFAAAAARARVTTALMRREGTGIRYLGSTLVPEDESCFCTFEGSIEAVREANERAALAFERILECRCIAGDRLDAAAGEGGTGEAPIVLCAKHDPVAASSLGDGSRNGAEHKRFR